MKLTSCLSTLSFFESHFCAFSTSRLSIFLYLEPEAVNNVGAMSTYACSLGHTAPITGVDSHKAMGVIDLSHLFLSCSLDWTVKLWSAKVSCFPRAI